MLFRSNADMNEGTDIKNKSGIIFRSIHEIEKETEKYKLKGYSVEYNEMIKDLMSGNMVQIVHENNKISLKNCIYIECKNRITEDKL